MSESVEGNFPERTAWQATRDQMLTDIMTAQSKLDDAHRIIQQEEAIDYDDNNRAYGLMYDAAMKISEAIDVQKRWTQLEHWGKNGRPKTQ